MWSQKSWPYTHTKKLLNLNLISRWRYLMVSNKNSWYVTYVTKRWNEVLRLYIPSCTLKLKGYIWKDQEMESQNYEESLKNAQNWHGFTIISHLFPLTNNQWMILVWWILDVECFNGFCSLWNRYISLSESFRYSERKRCLRPGKMSRIPEVQKDIWPWQRSATKGPFAPSLIWWLPSGSGERWSPIVSIFLLYIISSLDLLVGCSPKIVC